MAENIFKTGSMIEDAIVIKLEDNDGVIGIAYTVVEDLKTQYIPFREEVITEVDVDLRDGSTSTVLVDDCKKKDIKDLLERHDNFLMISDVMFNVDDVVSLTPLHEEVTSYEIKYIGVTLEEEVIKADEYVYRYKSIRKNEWRNRP